MKNLDGGCEGKNSTYIYVLFIGKDSMESKIIEYAICGNLIQILLHKYMVEVISKLLFTSFAHKLQEDSENTFSYLFHNHEIMM